MQDDLCSQIKIRIVITSGDSAPVLATLADQLCKQVSSTQSHVDWWSQSLAKARAPEAFVGVFCH